MLLGLQLLKEVLTSKNMELFYSLNQKWFVDDELSTYKKIKKYITKYNKLPPPSFIKEDSDGYTLDYLLDEVSKRYKLLELNRLGTIINTETEPDVIISKANSIINELSVTNKDVLYNDDLVTTVKENIERLRARYLVNGLIGYDTGWQTLNRVLGGYSQGDIVVFSSRAKIGKTMLLIYSANVSLNSGLRVLFVSMEMTPEQILKRLTTLRNRISYNVFFEAISSFTERALIDSIDTIKDKLYLVSGNLQKDVGQISILISTYRPDIVFIDGAYLIRTGKHRQSLWEEVTDVIVRLKNVALQHNVPIVCSYQLNRTGAKKDNLGLEHLALADAIGQIASCVIGIVEVEIPTQRKMEVIAIRDGQSQDYFINWDWTTMNFTEIGGEYENEEIQETEPSLETLL